MKCIICGKEMERSSYLNADLCSSVCYTKHYWLEKIQNKNSLRQVIVNNVMYYIGDENSNSTFRGFDGALWLIKFNDGRKIRTTNLWHNGEIPEDYRSELPNNASFVKATDFPKENIDSYTTYGGE
jgi:hypothetical protein